jgi:hypothetical protein
MADYTPYVPSYPSMAPTASSFNYQPPTQNLQTILGGLQGTGSTFGMPWAPGYTAQPGITTPMGRGVSQLNPQGVNPFPFRGGPVTPARPAAPAAAPAAPAMDPQTAIRLASQNNLRARLGLSPLAPGTPQYQQWMRSQNQMPAWAGPAERAGGGIGNAGPPSGGRDPYGNDATGGSMGGHL